MGGVKLNNGRWIEAQQNIDGGPSVLYDAIVLLVSKDGAQTIANEQVVKNFINDAFYHFKFLAYVEEATLLLEKAGINTLDAGCILINKKSSWKIFLNKCKRLRFWQRNFAK